jgi:hypothetical protein
MIFFPNLILSIFEKIFDNLIFNPSLFRGIPLLQEDKVCVIGPDYEKFEIIIKIGCNFMKGDIIVEKEIQ